MAQNYIQMGTLETNTVKIRQPDEGLGYDFETKYTEDTDRLLSGHLYLRPLFTVEALSYKATNISRADVAQILGYIAKGNSFWLHYFSPYRNAWVTNPFYVGKGNMSIGRLIENGEYFDSLEFQMTGVLPL